MPAILIQMTVDDMQFRFDLVQCFACGWNEACLIVVFPLTKTQLLYQGYGCVLRNIRQQPLAENNLRTNKREKYNNINIQCVFPNEKA